MSEQKTFPANWLIASDWDPQEHMLNLKGKEYLAVQDRMLWFVRDMRALIAAGLATTSYAVRTELIEIDRERGFAHFQTYVRDVLGNEATMTGSEERKDFGDYAEKASTKSLGRALAALGYGTAAAPEMDEGERVVDSPQEPRKRQPQQRRDNGVSPQRPATQQTEEPGETDQQRVGLRKLCQALGKPEPEEKLSYGAARNLLKQLSDEYQRARRELDSDTPTPTPIRPQDEPMDDFDLMENDDLASYCGVLGNDYRNEFVRVCGIKPKGGYTQDDGVKWHKHLVGLAREKTRVEAAAKPKSLRELPVGKRGHGA